MPRLQVHVFGMITWCCAKRSLENEFSIHSSVVYNFPTLFSQNIFTFRISINNWIVQKERKKCLKAMYLPHNRALLTSMWINTKIDWQTVHSYSCYAMIGQLLFGEGVIKRSIPVVITQMRSIYLAGFRLNATADDTWSKLGDQL